jgi:antitoxin HicB
MQQYEGDIADYMKRPYARVLVPEEDGTYRGEILEFPGCISTGDTAAEALDSLEEIAESWIASALANGQSVPPPSECDEYSGKLLLRMPKSLHRKAARMAGKEGVSLNHFITTSLAHHVGEKAAMEAMSYVRVTNTDAPASLSAIATDYGSHGHRQAFFRVVSAPQQIATNTGKQISVQ